MLDTLVFYRFYFVSKEFYPLSNKTPSMDNQNNPTSTRRKFLFLGLTTAAFFSVFKSIRSDKKKKPVKMLTQDGKLVEIDPDIISGNKKKITDQELKTWVKK